MTVPFEFVCNVIFIAACVVLMGVGLVSLAQQFVQGMIDKHERAHHRADRKRSATTDGH